MPRLPHGQVVTGEAQQDTLDAPVRNALAFAAVTPLQFEDFDYLFPALQSDPEALLPESRDTVAHLKALGATMTDDDAAASGDSAIPAAYTYFGQFIDHDITLEGKSGPPPSRQADCSPRT
jgi:hypothetical protein